jgi:hypothetical protein
MTLFASLALIWSVVVGALGLNADCQSVSFTSLDIAPANPNHIRDDTISWEEVCKT